LGRFSTRATPNASDNTRKLEKISSFFWQSLFQIRGTKAKLCGGFDEYIKKIRKNGPFFDFFSKIAEHALNKVENQHAADRDRCRARSTHTNDTVLGVGAIFCYITFFFSKVFSPYITPSKMASNRPIKHASAGHNWTMFCFAFDLCCQVSQNGVKQAL